MKGRSQRLQSANQPDDWVDDSWTVDCICGVNFDDGEEMVKCDECGVWVHTRCSRYVKEEELFACDKCKNRNSRNDIEETEVAQLLVELPTTTVRIESNYVASGTAKKPPFRVWTELPMEEKVHVQGVPGGDPGLFSGLSSVFSQQLWKCTGYVPKAFNFQYKEFPCWDAEKEDVARVEENNETALDKGAGVLFSLSKERVLASPGPALMRTRNKGEDVSNDKKARQKESKRSELGDVDIRRSHSGTRKEKNMHRPVIVYSGKRKKEELGISKDIIGKKKARITDKDADAKRRSTHASRTVFTPSSDAKQLEFYEDRGAKSFKTDIRSVKNRNLRGTVAVEPNSDCRIAVTKTDEVPKHDVAAKGHIPEASSAGLTGDCPHVPVKDKIPNKVSEVSTSAAEVVSTDGCNSGSQIKVVENCSADNLNGGSSDKLLDLPDKSIAAASPQVKDNRTSLEMNTDKFPGSQKPNLKVEVDDDSARLVKSPASHPDVYSPKMSPDTAKISGVTTEDISGNCKGNDLVASSLQCGDKKSMEVAQNEGQLSDCNGVKDAGFSADARDCKEDANGSEVSTLLRKSLSDPKQFSGDEDLSKSGVTVSSAAPPSRLKIAVSLGKASPTVSSSVISKSSSSNKCKPSDTRKALPVGYHAAADFKGLVTTDITSDEGKNDAVRKKEEHSLSHSSRLSHTSVPKGNAADSKDSVISSSSKSSSAQNVSAKIGPADTQNQSALPAQSRSASSVLSSKVGKSNHTASHPPLKGNHAAGAHQPVVSKSPAGLSDEELALLLHQELNSSPRVPRVPRVRQANLPQLASQAASTLHIKRSSSSGAKDQISVSKRKGKDSTKDSGTRPREVEDEARKTGRATFSSDHKRQDKLCNADASTREAKRSPSQLHSLKKNASSLSTSANSGPSTSNEANDTNRFSGLASPMSNSDDDFTTDQPLVYRTLPGLINEIMSKGKRMTYEELCDAVLPHWPSLRKHNGERYAYSSHSQAVLDCLRNRHEWAQLVDRGPKTNSCRKRRRADSQDDEDDEDSKQRTSRDMESKSLEPQRDDVPKGKRRARRGRRLTLHGREIRKLRSKRKADTLSDDDDDAVYSDATEDGVFSEEDDIQEGGEASSASEEMRNS